jgi:hypothetical protein
MALSMLAQRTVAPVRPARATRATVVVRAASAPRSAAQLVQQVAKPAATALVANLLMAMPSMAAGKLFDFNLTLPIMASEILILMVFLDKFWFTPVGKVLDERDTLLRSQLSTVKGGSEELDRLTKVRGGERKSGASGARCPRFRRRLSRARPARTRDDDAARRGSADGIFIVASTIAERPQERLGVRGWQQLWGGSAALPPAGGGDDAVVRRAPPWPGPVLGGGAPTAAVAVAAAA